MAASRFERREFHHGLECVSVISAMGFRCGYVCLPPSHPWYGLDTCDFPNGRRARLELNRGRIMRDFHQHYERAESIDFLIEAHGELTHSGELGTRGLEGDWFLGFDCGHAWDGQDPELMSPAHRDIHERYGLDGVIDGPVRSMRYVLDVAAQVAEQVQLHSRGAENRLRWALRRLTGARRPLLQRPRLVLWGARRLEAPYGGQFDYLKIGA